MSNNESMPQEQLDAIRRREAKATAGPWSHWSGWEQWDHSVMSYELDDAPTVANIIPELDDAEFIAHAREDVPALLAEVERLRALTTVTEDMVERGKAAHHEAFNAWKAKRSLEDSDNRRVAAMRAALDAALGTGEGS